jgi:tRNA(Ile)-lysidine synthase
MLLHKELLLHDTNLLAFSAGVDSTALLFLLLENNIKFDIAILNYGLREQSKDEITYAQELAKRYNFKCHLLNAKKITTNFESNARTIRYDFFEQLIKEHKYKNLLTAHHLGDRFEWMLMQFCKGAGCAELAGMNAIESRGKYTLLRPLLHLEKQELLSYLNANNLNYFEDESNKDEKYKRNEFRHNYAKPLLDKYLSGIKKSFEYLDEDVESLIKEVKIEQINEFAYLKPSSSKRSDIFAIDKYLKSKCHIITANERKLLQENEVVVVGRKFVISQTSLYIFITPFLEAKGMSKEFKEKMRLLKIEPKLRAYFFLDSEAVVFVSRLLQ